MSITYKVMTTKPPSIASDNLYVTGPLVVSSGAHFDINQHAMIRGAITTGAGMPILREDVNMFGSITLCGARCVSVPSITYDDAQDRGRIVITDVARDLREPLRKTDTIPTTGACMRYIRAGLEPESGSGQDLLCCAYFPSLSISSIACACTVQATSSCDAHIDVVAPTNVSRACTIECALYQTSADGICKNARILANAPKFAGMIVELRDITYISTPNLTWFAVDTRGRNVETC